MFLVVPGCNIHQFSAGEPSTRQVEDKFWAGVRPASGETDRLLRNFRFLKQAGRTHLALKEVEQAYRQDPGNMKVIDILAQCYEELGAWDKAEKLYLEALAKDKDNAALANNLCFSYYQAGKLDKAEACFRDLLRRQPENTAVRNNLGLLLAKTGRQDEAYRLWRETEAETVARERLNQALAALGITPSVKVARLPEPKATPLAAPLPGAADSPAPVKATAAVPPQSSPSAQPSVTTPVQIREMLPVAAPVAPNSLTSQAIGKQAYAPVATAPPAVVPAEGAADTKTSEPVKPEVVQVSEKPDGKQSPEAPPASVKPIEPVTAPAPMAAAAEPVPAAKTQAPLAPEKPAAKPVTPPPPVAKPEPAAAPPGVPGKPLKVAAPASAKPAPTAKTATAVPREPGQRVFLSAHELVNTGLKILNGNGVKGIAALNRTWLTMEGFTVAAIGNHLDFGMKKTLIQYHPDSKRVAKALQQKFFPQADLSPNSKLGKGVQVEIVLGREQKARKSQIEERIALLDLKAQLTIIRAASEKTPAGEKAVAAPKPPTKTTQQAVKAPPTTPAAADPVGKPRAEAPKLTAAEMAQTRIELRNGNGFQDHARQLRSELSLQGFHVVRIRNHIDFGMNQTAILYRPGADKVAQALGVQHFRTAKLAESNRLPEDVDIKVILGKDLPGGPDMMAHLAP
jgi:hypothetical protein